jgi:hypothetical protein
MIEVRGSAWACCKKEASHGHASCVVTAVQVAHTHSKLIDTVQDTETNTAGHGNHMVCSKNIIPPVHCRRGASAWAGLQVHA